MLRDNHICKLNRQYFKTMETEYFKNNILSSNCRLLYTLRGMFNANESMLEAFVTEATLALRAKKICNESAFPYGYEVLATYGVLMSGFVFGYNILEKNKSKRMKMYTTSMTMLENLASKRVLVGKKYHITEELADIEKKLYNGNRIANSVRDGGKVVAVRLDFEIQTNRVVRCTAVIPRSALDLNTTILVPYETYVTAQGLFEDLVKQKILNVTFNNKIVPITKNYTTLASIYGEDRSLSLVNQFNDVRMGKFYMPVVGASIHTSGLINLPLEEIDKVEVVNSIAEVDLSEIKVNFGLAREHICSCIDELPEPILMKIFKKLGLEDRGWELSEIRSFCCTLVNSLSDRDAYELLKKYKKSLKFKSFLSAKSRYGDSYIILDIPSSVKELESMLNSGIFKIRYLTRRGDFAETTVTNNRDCLRKFLGANYESVYESKGVRLHSASRLLDHADNSDVQNIFNSLGFGEETSNIATKEAAASFIKSELYDVDMNKTVVNQPHLVKARSLTVTPDTTYDYYKNIDLRSITEFVCLHVVE